MKKKKDTIIDTLNGHSIKLVKIKSKKEIVRQLENMIIIQTTIKKFI